ncbi:MAG TPA: hypothetical protein VN765_06955 [Candidatus Acidoferrum sp.]|nr:hypothetical protein [Candidatus Acidoferrum sp.]
MLINTSFSPEAAAQDLRNSRAAHASGAPAPANAPETRGDDPAFGRLQGLVPLEEQGVPGINDAAGADQITEMLRANLLSEPALALAAQANLSPESVFKLLQ